LADVVHVNLSKDQPLLDQITSLITKFTLP